MEIDRFDYNGFLVESFKYSPKSLIGKSKQLTKKIAGNPTNLIFFHGIATPFQHLETFISICAEKGYTVYGFNLPGHGATPALTWASGFNWDWVVGLTESYINQLQLKDFILTGHSMGGGVIQKYLAESKLLPNSVVLFAPYPDTGLISIDGAKIMSGFIEHVKQHQELANNSIKIGAGTAGAPAIAAIYEPLFQNFSVDLQAFPVPTKVIMLELDPAIPPDLLKKYFEGRINIELVLAKDYTHEIMLIPMDKQKLLVEIAGF